LYHEKCSYRRQSLVNQPALFDVEKGARTEELNLGLQYVGM